MIFDQIEWDEHNLDHATRRLTAAEIEQAILNAPRMRKHPREPRSRQNRVGDRWWKVGRRDRSDPA
jgi:hypothetical protein